MNCNKTSDAGVPRYLNNCNCEGVLDELLESEEEYRPACNIDRWRVAMTYVPMQSWEEPYSPAKGLKRGTIFPCLDLPFRGGGGR